MTAKSEIEPVAWMTQDGERVVTSIAKDRMPRAVAEPYTDPLFTLSQLQEVERRARIEALKEALAIVNTYEYTDVAEIGIKKLIEQEQKK